MKKIVIFAVILFAISSLVAQDLSYAEGHAFFLDGTTTHNAAEFGFQVVEYKEYSNFSWVYGAPVLTPAEMEALLDPYAGNTYTYNFNIPGEVNGADAYNELDGYFLWAAGGFVDATDWGTSLAGQFYPGAGFGFNYDYEIVAEITFYGNDDGTRAPFTQAEYYNYVAPNFIYDLGTVLFGEGGTPPVPGYGMITTDGTGNPNPVDVEPINIGAGRVMVNPDMDFTPCAVVVDFAVQVAETVTNVPIPHPENVQISYVYTITGDISSCAEVCFTLYNLDELNSNPNIAAFFDGVNWSYIVGDWSVADQVSFCVPNVNGGEIVLNQLGDDPLPVTLSNFATAVFENEFVEISWTTESSASMSLWNLIRDDVIIHTEAAVNGTETHDYIYEDTYVTVGETYTYYLEAVENDGTTTMFGPVSATMTGEEIPELPTETMLLSQYPNPFNPDTFINFNVKEGENAKLTIFNTKGQVVTTRSFVAGSYNYNWVANSSPSGVYFYRLESPSYSNVKKMMLLK